MAQTGQELAKQWLRRQKKSTKTFATQRLVQHRLNAYGDLPKYCCPTCVPLCEVSDPCKSALGYVQPSGYRIEVHCENCNNLKVILGDFSIFCRKATEIIFSYYLKEWRWYCASIINESENGWQTYLLKNEMQIAKENSKDRLCIKDPDWVFRSEAEEKNLLISVELAEKIAVFNEMPPA